MKRVSAKSTLVADMTSVLTRVVWVGSTIGVDRSRSRRGWILVERIHVRILFELKTVSVGHSGVELGRASQVGQSGHPPNASESENENNLKRASDEV